MDPDLTFNKEILSVLITVIHRLISHFLISNLQNVFTCCVNSQIVGTSFITMTYAVAAITVFIHMRYQVFLKGSVFQITRILFNKTLHVCCMINR